MHVVVFFIFLVSNIGGSLTPLGDPPLFLGFLRGVDFFWTTRHLFLAKPCSSPGCCSRSSSPRFLALPEEGRRRPDPTPDQPVRVNGGVNFILIAVDHRRHPG